LKGCKEINPFSADLSLPFFFVFSKKNNQF
jgi:hypothetical protein